MTEQAENQSNQQGMDGGGSQSGQQKPPETPQQPPQQIPELPKELADLGFKDSTQVLGYLREVSEDARKSKEMFKTLAEQIKQRSQGTEAELTDDDFVQSPKQATERATKKLLSQFEDRINPLASQLVEGNVVLQKMQLRQDPVFGGLVPDLEKELDEYLLTIPPELKVRPNAVRTAMEYVVGRNFPRVSKKFNEMAARAGAATEGGSNSSPAGGSTKSAPQLSEDERIAAQKQIAAGIFKDMDDYNKWRDQ